MAKYKTARSGARLDVYGNFYRSVAATSVADTPAFNEWITGFSIKDGYAFIIHKIRYRVLPGTITSMNAEGDSVILGLTTRSDLSNTQLSVGIDNAILDTMYFGRHQDTAVGFEHREQDHIHDFTNDPGGGRIVAPKPLYIAASSIGLGATYSAYMEIIYTMIKLTESAYRELYESMNPNA
jgi:hypothetical protein